MQDREQGFARYTLEQSPASHPAAGLPADAQCSETWRRRLTLPLKVSGAQMRGDRQLRGF
jgi:hypothetical protein